MHFFQARVPGLPDSCRAEAELDDRWSVLATPAVAGPIATTRPMAHKKRNQRFLDGLREFV
jgi:hypothetical protein